MTAVRFNTLNFANRLKEVGVAPKQAEMMAQLQEEIINNVDINSVATRKDILEFRDATRKDILEFRDATRKDILEIKEYVKTLEVSIIKWVITIATGQLALMIGLIHYIK